MHMHVLGENLRLQEIMPLWSALSIYISSTFQQRLLRISVSPVTLTGRKALPGSQARLVRC